MLQKRVFQNYRNKTAKSSIQHWTWPKYFLSSSVTHIFSNMDRNTSKQTFCIDFHFHLLDCHHFWMRRAVAEYY